MPEGPEVLHEMAKLQAMCGHVIKKARIVSGRYTKRPIEKFGQLEGDTITGIEVKGKLIVIYMKYGAVLSTMGMSGKWVANIPVEKVKYARLEIIMSNDANFVFADQRNFGTFKVVSRVEAEKRMEELGVDIFRTDDKVIDDLKERLRRFGRYPLCEVLMDQRVFAGVGNYIRAEALYLTQLDPFMDADELKIEQLKKLWAAIQQVGRDAYRLGSNYKDLCYRREVADCGRTVHSHKDSNNRVLWYVKWKPSDIPPQLFA